MNNAFRSHLMQQFAASARSQSRPPLALLGFGNDDEVAPSEHLNETSRRAVSSIATNTTRTFSCTPSSVAEPSSASPVRQPQRRPFTETSFRFTSSLTVSDEEDEDEDILGVSTLFQNMIQTRRSNSSFLPSNESADYWKQILARAVQCAIQAPNHKRTEPFTFKRMISPSPTTEKLASIASKVSLRDDQAKKLEARPSVPAMLEKAEKKRKKWSKVPAFLVAICNSKDTIIDNVSITEENQLDDLPFRPPSTERELEDYAATCAAVQNVLLSLHAEQIASKWATGPVIRTRAFRDLVQAEPGDRIVGLIMIGQPDDDHKPRVFRHRRSLQGDVLTDI